MAFSSASVYMLVYIEFVMLRKVKSYINQKLHILQTGYATAVENL